MFEKLKNMVENAEKIAIFTHENPDGDALGSSYAFALGLLWLGKKANVFLGDFKKNTKEYREICGKEMLSDITPDECDLKIALETIQRMMYVNIEQYMEMCSNYEMELVTITLKAIIIYDDYTYDTVVGNPNRLFEFMQVKVDKKGKVTM